MLRRSTAPKSASAFASGIGRHQLRVELDADSAKVETIGVPTATDRRIGRRQSAVVIGKSFGEFAALLFAEWFDKARKILCQFGRANTMLLRGQPLSSVTPKRFCLTLL